nr:hypothetical protein [Tanacetum cinerariifolium]
SGVGRGVKKKDANVTNLEVVKYGVVPSVTVALGSTQMVSTGPSLPTVVDLMMENDKLSSVEDTTVLESFSPLSTPVTTAGNSPGKSSYANITGKPSGKKVNVCTLFTPGGNGIDVVVSVDFIRAINERFANITYGFFLGKKVAYHVVANYVRNTWGKYGLVHSMFSSSTRLFSFQFSSINGLDAMLEHGLWFIWNNPLILKNWHPDENLLKEDVSTVPVWVKLQGVPVIAFSEDGLSAIATKLGIPLMLDSYTSDMYMQFWGRSSYGRVMIELQADVELKDNIVNTGAGEKKTVKKPSQTSRGKLRLLDNYGNPLVPTGIVESDSEVEVVFDETANLRISTSGKDKSDKGYGTNSLLEQWRDSYPGNDDYDPNNDDMYKNHDLSEHLQSICDDLDITVRGSKKK